MPRRKAPEPKRRRRRGSGSIQPLVSGSFRARLPSTIDPKRTSREFPTRAEAEAWVDACLHPQPATVEAVTVRVWTGAWWQTFVEPIHPPNTARWCLYALRKLEPLYDAELPDVRRSALQAVVGRLAAEIGPATLRGVVGVWRRCFEAAVDDELIARNPARNLALPKAAPKASKRFVTPAEAALLRAAIVGHRFEACYALLLGCGLRIGEALGLAWADVDLHGRRAWIQRQWTNSHWRPLPKGRNPHWVRLPDPVVSALIRHRNAQAVGAVLVMQSPFNRPGRGQRRPRRSEPHPWSAQMVGKDLRALLADLELAPMTPHAARRGLATALLDGNVSPAVIAERLGHADAAITLRAYTMPTDEGQARASEITDRYLGSDDSWSETVC